MRSDRLSRRLFSAGCLGLPWLWAVHALYWRGLLKEAAVDGEADASQAAGAGGGAPPLLNPDDHFPEGDAAAAEASMTPEEVKAAAEVWVRRCRRGALASFTVWAVWIVASQVLRAQGLLPAKLFMLNADDAALTGW